MRLEVLLSDHVEMYSFESIDISFLSIIKEGTRKEKFH